MERPGLGRHNKAQLFTSRVFSLHFVRHASTVKSWIHSTVVVQGQQDLQSAPEAWPPPLFENCSSNRDAARSLHMATGFPRDKVDELLMKGGLRGPGTSRGTSRACPQINSCAGYSWVGRRHRPFVRVNGNWSCVTQASLLRRHDTSLTLQCLAREHMHKGGSGA